MTSPTLHCLLVYLSVRNGEIRYASLLFWDLTGRFGNAGLDPESINTTATVQSLAILDKVVRIPYVVLKFFKFEDIYLGYLLDKAFANLSRNTNPAQ